MTRADQRRSFLVSAVVHLVLMTVLSNEINPIGAAPPPAVSLRPPAERVFLPPPEVLRQLVPAPARPAPTPPAVPTPPPAPNPAKKDRMSVGAPALVREEGPVQLRRDQDLTEVAKGRPDAIPEAGAPQPTPEPEPTPTRVGANRLDEPGPGGSGLRLPTLGEDLSGDGPGERGPGPQRPAIGRTLRDLDRIIGETGPVGLESGTGKQMGPLHYDPRGADFTGWVNQFRTEFYRNLIVPQSVWITRPGETRIALEFDRDGRLIDSRVLQSSGNEAFDRAMLNAFRSSRYYRLPEDYDLETFKVVVTII